MTRRLVLFDIDGTLIARNVAGREVLSQALREVFGTDGSLATTSFAGQTDLGIISTAMSATGLAETDLYNALPSVYDAMTRNGEAAFIRGNLQLCPGVLPLLRELRANRLIVLGLQTGNIRNTALQKLKAAGLEPSWFIVGAFGSDSLTREGLFPAAWARAYRLTGELFSGHNTIAVGDTPGDIVAAQTNGATAVAVASGFTSYAELAEYAPEHLLRDLSPKAHVMSILMGSK